MAFSSQTRFKDTQVNGEMNREYHRLDCGRTTHIFFKGRRWACSKDIFVLHLFSTALHCPNISGYTPIVHMDTPNLMD